MTKDPITLKTTRQWTYVFHLQPEVQKLLAYELSYVVPGARFTDAYRRHVWDGRKTLYNKTMNRFPTALISRVTAWLEKHEYEYQSDLLELPGWEGAYPTSLNLQVQDREYQVHALRKALAHGRGILHIAPNGGKTEIGLAILNAWLGQKKKGLYLCPANLVQQVYKRAIERLDWSPGIICSTRVDLEDDDLVIASVETLYSRRNKKEYQDYLKMVRCLVIDEAHHGKAPTWYTLARDFMDPEHLYGMSATPFGGRPDDLMLEAACGKVIVQVSTQFLIELGFSKPIEVHLYTYDHGMNLQDDAREEDYRKAYQDDIVENMDRMGKAVATVKERYADRNGIIFVGRIEHTKRVAKAMREAGLSAKAYYGEMEDRYETLQAFRDGRVRYLVSTHVLKEGADFPDGIGLLGIWAGEGDMRNVPQRVGRALRNGGGHAFSVVMDITDKGVYYFGTQAKRRVGIYRREGFPIKRIATWKKVK